MIGLEATFLEHLLKIPIAEWITQIPGNRLHDRPCLEMPCRFSFSAIAFRIIGSLHNFRSGNLSSHGQHTVKRQNLRQARAQPSCERPAGASGHVTCRRNVAEYSAHAAHALRGDLRCFPFRLTCHPPAQGHLAIENRHLHDIVRQSEFQFQAHSNCSGKGLVVDRNDGVCGQRLFLRCDGEILCLICRCGVDADQLAATPQANLRGGPMVEGY